MRFLILMIVTLFPSLVLAAGNVTNDSYNNAKRMLNRQVYYDHRETLYCGAEYNAANEILLPAGFKTPAHQKRAERMEWEHAVPAENFGRAFVEWREGAAECVHRGQPFKGRRCAEKVNKDFRYMQSDMYNLFPSIGAVNAVRGNSQYSELPGKKSSFGVCEAKISGNRFEPPARAKGQIARTALYMEDSYPIYRISSQQKQLFEAWDKMYPVTAWECERARRIEKLQGNSNSRVKIPCEKAGL